MRESSSTETWVARASVLTLAVTSDVLIPSGFGGGGASMHDRAETR